MPVLYGAPLPPGLDASTKGELQIRIDKLILDDAVLNHNPLVQQSLAGRGRGGDAASEGPNRFVVPIDHCTVSPQFWGEARPSAQCQPATPHQRRRGSVNITYPVKVREESFAQYLRNMTRSPQKGLRLEVAVPPSYSGRKARVVGECTLALDPLCDGAVIEGWFTVLHDRRPFAAGSAMTDALDGARATPQTDEAAATPLPPRLAIGRVKLRIQLVYFSRAAPAVARGATHVTGHKSVTTPPAVTSTAATQTPSSAEPAPTVVKPRDNATPPPPPPHGSAQQTDDDDHDCAAPDDAAACERERRRTTALAELLQRSIQLRDRIADAAASLGPSTTTSSAPLLAPRSGLVGAAADYGTAGASVQHSPTPPRVHGTESDELDEDETLYTSECSDAESQSLAPQHHPDPVVSESGHGSEGGSTSAVGNAMGKRRRGARGTRASGATTAQDDDDDEVDEFADAVAASSSGHVVGVWTTGVTIVELRFSDIAFATNAMTAELTAMRLNVRLSADIATEAPNTGPFSSYVHPVPLRCPAICLSFAIRAYSEQASRLVIECLRVHSASAQNTRSGSDAEEELLGLCIVGLYAQSRAIVLRDPVNDLNNVFGRLTVRLTGPHPASSIESPGASIKATPTTVSRTPLRRPHTPPRHAELGVRVSAPSPPRTHDAATMDDDGPGGVPVVRSPRDAESGRFHLHVAILSAKEIPLVAVRDAHDAACAASLLDRRSFVAPNTFFVVEDVYSGVDGHVASTGPVSAWYVEHVHGGFHDRTCVVPCSRRPGYDYHCTLSLPVEGVYLKQRTPHGAWAGSAPKACLRELRLSLWHCTQDAMESHESDETRFWSHVAYMGESRIDLRPLRYLSHLDGYYRVVATSEARVADAAPVALCAVPGQTVGYVRVCVSLPGHENGVHGGVSSNQDAATT